MKRLAPGTYHNDLRLDPPIVREYRAFIGLASAPPARAGISAQARGQRFAARTVRDFGPGIPAAEVGHIFQLFYRPGIELTRETTGTGIGLALVRQLPRAMGDDVDVANRDPGAEFEVRLPSSSAPAKGADVQA